MFDSNGNAIVSKTNAKCFRCQAPIWFCTSWTTRRKYPVNVQPLADGTLKVNRRDFHNCNGQQAPAQTPVAAAVSAPINPQPAMTHDHVEQHIADNREALVAGLNRMFSLDAPVFDKPEARLIIPQADGTATSLPVPSEVIKQPDLAPPAQPFKRARPLSAPVAKSVNKPISKPATSGQAIYRCVTSGCQDLGVDFTGKLPSQTGNKPVTCNTCGNTARFTKRAD